MFLYDVLMDDDVVKSINDNIDKLVSLIPEIKDMIGFPHNHPHHHLDVWNHTILALSFSEKDFDVRLTLLLHDIGKPHSYQDSDVRHFKNHNIVSAEISKKILNRLGFNSNFIDRIYYLIYNHDTEITYTDIVKDYALQIKRYEIQRCDALAHHPEKLEKRLLYLDNTKKLISDYKNKSR